MGELFKSRLVVIDLETTGLDPSWAEAIEIGAVLLDTDGAELDTFSSLIKPEVLDKRADGALRVNRITPEMLAGQPNAYMVAGTFRGWMATRDARFLAAYNRKFDERFIEKMGIAGFRWASCIMERAKQHLRAAARHPGSGSLVAAAQFFGVTVDGDPHRALTDAITAARVAVAIRRRELGLDQGAA